MIYAQRLCLWATALGLSLGGATGLASSVQGSWEGQLQAGSARLRIVFHLQQDSNGRLAGTMDSPDQGARGIPLSDVVQRGDSLRIEVQAVRGSFRGTLLPGDSLIAGLWLQGGFRLPLQLRRGSTPEVPARMQEPVPPFPYSQEEVVFASRDPAVHLAGTLTLPGAGTPVPAVVLISGSGPQDRNETIFGHRPFLVLADDLTRRGIAVLRYDDRGVGQSGGTQKDATVEDFLADALGALAHLSGRSEIDRERIGILGHSEGGLVASLAALEVDSVAFVVLLASPGVPGQELLLLQSEALVRASGADETTIQRTLSLNRSVYAAVEADKDSAAIARNAGRILRSWADSLSEEERRGLGDLDTFLSRQLGIITSPWFRSFLNHDPRVTLRQLRCPVLALIGEKDLQVPPAANLTALGQALAEGGNERTVVRQLPGLNHLFQTAGTGLPAEYGTLEETFAPSALTMIGEWISSITTPRGR